MPPIQRLTRFQAFPSKETAEEGNLRPQVNLERAPKLITWSKVLTAKRKTCKALARCKQSLRSRLRRRADGLPIKGQLSLKREPPRQKRLIRRCSPRTHASRNKAKAIAEARALTTVATCAPLSPKRSPQRAIPTLFSLARLTRNSTTALPSSHLLPKLAIRPRTLTRSTRTAF